MYMLTQVLKPVAPTIAAGDRRRAACDERGQLIADPGAAVAELVLFGGVGGTQRPGSVWGWTGRTWRLIGCRS
jgi:hypothetical protein